MARIVREMRPCCPQKVAICTYYIHYFIFVNKFEILSHIFLYNFVLKKYALIKNHLTQICIK